MKKNHQYFFTLIGIFLYTQTFSQNIIRGPYLQVGTSVSIQLRWRTDVATNSKVSYGITTNGLINNFLDTTKTTEHQVTLTRLLPATKYFYSIGTSAKTLQGGAENFFITHPPIGTEKKIRIWATGDCGTGTQNQIDVKDQYLKFIGDNHTDAWLLLGDNAYGYGRDEEYQDLFFKPYQTNNRTLKQTSIYPCPGNHDYIATPSGQDDGKIPYFDIFSMPTKGEAGGVASGSKAYYSFDIGNVHFVSLDSYGKEQSQYRIWAGFTQQRIWLKKDLEANKQKWTVVYFHHPPYTMGSHNSDTEEELVNIRQYLVPVLEDFKIDLLLCGHSHNYERSYLSKGHYGQMATYDSTKNRGSSSSAKYDGSANSCPYIKPQQEGVVYVVAGTAGFVGGQQSTWPHKMMNTSITEAGSFYLEVEGNRLDAKFITEKGEIKDKFTIFKEVNQTKNITILPNQKITASASWVGTYKWANNTSTRTLTFAPPQSGIYSVKDEQNCLTDNFNVTVKPCAVGSFTVPLSDGTTKTATLECVGTDGYTHYYDELGNLLLSIKKNDLTIGKVSDASLKINLAGENGTVAIPQNYPNNYGFLINGLTTLKRYWTISPTPDITAPKNVQVRLYFTDQDFKTLQKNTVSKDLKNYYLLKINNLDNINPTNGHNNIPLAASPIDNGAWFNFLGDSLTANQWKVSFTNQIYVAEVNAPVLKGGYILGATTDGKQSSAYFDKFDGKYMPFDAVELNWQTIAELKNGQFVIEKSLDKVKFDSIGIVKSQILNNKIGIVAYQFTDKKAIYPTIYYRLRSVGQNEVSFSKTIAINVPITSVSPTENSEFLIYPNPTNIEKVQFKDKVVIEGFRIITADGKMVMSKNEKAEIQDIELGVLPVGRYLLQILNKGLWYSQKVLIVK